MKNIKYNNLCVLIITELLKIQERTRQRIGAICKRHNIKTMEYYQIKAVATQDFDSPYMKGRQLKDEVLIRILASLGYKAERIYSLEKLQANE